MQDVCVSDDEEQTKRVQPGGMRIAAEVRTTASADVSVVVSGDGSDDWPPVSYAANDHILVWWLPEYDDVLRRLVAEYQWAWRGEVLESLEPLIPPAVLRSWRDADPQCQEYSWYNVLGVFAAARAKQLGIAPRPAAERVCSCCSRQFLESHLSHRHIAWVGVDTIDVCPACLNQALQTPGSLASPPETVLAVLQVLARELARPPKAADLSGRPDLRDLPPGARAAVVQALRVKPTAKRVRELFGSWEAALADAAAAPAMPIPDYQHDSLSHLPDSEFTSSDPGRYQALTGPLPEVSLDPGHDESDYYHEITSLIGAGYLALAEAALTKLCARPHDMNFDAQLAQVYGQTGRIEQARAIHRAIYRNPGEDEQEAELGPFSQPRDVRTITSGPAIYSPLPSRPRGNVCFVRRSASG
jgi:hypothetical protein